MGGKYSFRPLPCGDVKRVLRGFGFQEVRQTASHSRWEAIRDGRKFKVTVDCHKGEVKALDVRSIISQAGLTKEQFFDAL